MPFQIGNTSLQISKLQFYKNVHISNSFIKRTHEKKLPMEVAMLKGMVVILDVAHLFSGQCVCLSDNGKYIFS